MTGKVLDGARMVRYDPSKGLTLAWFGGHGVYAFDQAGSEVSFWNVGPFDQPDADPVLVEQSMLEILTGKEDLP